MARFREIQNPQKIVDAVQLTEETIYVFDIGKEVKADLGDWQVTYKSPTTAQIYVGLITDENFVKTYQPLDLEVTGADGEVQGDQ